MRPSLALARWRTTRRRTHRARRGTTTTPSTSPSPSTAARRGPTRSRTRRRRTAASSTRCSRSSPSTRLCPVCPVGTAGTVYAGWSDQLHGQYTYSRDGGRTWAPARQVNRDNPAQTSTSTLTAPTPGNADVFPWIAAGGAGRIDVVWYHGAGGAAGSESKYRDPGDANTTWTVAAAQITAASSTKPTVATYSDTVSPVIHTGDICQNGINCDVLGGDRTLLDF